MNWRAILTAVLYFWVWYYTPNLDRLHADQEITIRVNPKITIALPTTVRVQARVTPHPGNRQFCWVWANEDGMPNSSCFPLEAEKAPISHSKFITIREPGVWTFAVVAVRNDETYVKAVDTVEVRGGMQ